MVLKSLRGLAGVVSLSLILNGIQPAQEYVSRQDNAVEFILSPKFPPLEKMVRMYIDCNQRDYSSGNYLKTAREVSEGVVERENFEILLKKYFKQQTRGINLDISNSVYDPLKGRGIIRNNFNDPRLIDGKWEEKHDAIDLFAKVGTEIYAPVNGIVVASSDDWKGHWDKREGLVYESGGLTRISGNGVLIFDPSDKLYYFLIHMQEVYPKTGSVVIKGDSLGTVGRTGSASAPYSPTHLHLALKRQGSSCGVENVLTSINPYLELRTARNVFDSAHHNF